MVESPHEYTSGHHGVSPNPPLPVGGLRFGVFAVDEHRADWLSNWEVIRWCRSIPVL